MATAAQIEANRRNALCSTGLRTPEGKARAAARAISPGLFTARDFVAGGDESEYALFVAAWRLRRGVFVESISNPARPQ